MTVIPQLKLTVLSLQLKHAQHMTQHTKTMDKIALFSITVNNRFDTRLKKCDYVYILMFVRYVIVMHV